LQLTAETFRIKKLKAAAVERAQNILFTLNKRDKDKKQRLIFRAGLTRIL
jgi:hypothetical protein